jgi:hypothetical protein
MTEAAAYSPIAVDAVDKGKVVRGSFGTALTVGLSGTLIAALWLTGHGDLLRVAIPMAALFVGVILYFYRPIRYVEYTLWLWFLTPLIRRLVDWRFGYADPNFVLLAPLLVSGVGGLALLRPNDRHTTTRMPPSFLLCGTAVLYAVIVDAIQDPSLDTVYGLADWLCPLLFGLHLCLNWRSYEQYRVAISRAFLYAVPVLGMYGIYQFFAPPAWDCYWLTNANLNTYAGVSSFGQPEPLLVRVWSTMNAPGPFANTMMVGLLLLLVVRSHWKVPAAIAGYLSFLLSMVRTAWLSWLVGLLLILKGTNPRAIARICLSIVLLVACILPFGSDPRVATVIKDRVNTFTDLTRDGSFQARSDMYATLLDDVVNNPFGHGFKNRGAVHGFVVDSGILVSLFTLGWVGSLLFTAGILALCFKLRRAIDHEDQFSIAAKGIVIALLAQIIGGNVFVSVTGAMFWLFGGVSMAAREHYRNQSMILSSPDDAALSLGAAMRQAAQPSG